MPATVRAAMAATAIFLALDSTAAAIEEKSTKPRIAVLEFKDKADAQLDIDSVRWGEWIADVERPQAVGSWAKADGLGVSWDVAESPVSPTRANDRLRNAGPKDGWPAIGRGMDIATIDGEILAPGSTAGKQPKTRPMVLAPGGTRPRPSASAGSADRGGNALDRPTFGETFMGGLKKHGTVEGAIEAEPGANETVTVGAKRTESASGPATGKRQHMPIRTRTYYDAPLQRGSVMLRLTQPWAGCAVGDRFNGAYLTTGVTHKYRLDGAEIVACGGSTVTINYTKFAAEGTPVR